MKTVALPNEVLIPAIKSAIDEGHTVTFCVRGFSMRPFLEDRRDQVVLSPLGDKTVRTGDVILAEIYPQHYVLHRVVSRQSDTLTLRGDGNVWGTEKCSISNVIGRATCFLRGKSQRPCSTAGLKWKVYSLLWPQAPLIRRILLAAYRRIIVPLASQSPETPSCGSR